MEPDRYSDGSHEAEEEEPLKRLKKLQKTATLKSGNDDDTSRASETSKTSPPAQAFPIQALPVDVLSRSASMLPYREQMDNLALTNKIIRASIMGLMRRAAYSGE